MSIAPSKAPAPVDWHEGLARSKSEIAAGKTVDLLPVLEDLRVAAERLEAGGNETPKVMGQTAGQ